MSNINILIPTSRSYYRMALNECLPKPKIQVQNTISLGCNCHTSYLLKQLGLKKFSCPFDWLACTLDDVTSILESNFEDFIAPEYLCEHEEMNPKKCGHKRYGNKTFHHFNPRIPEHHDYYQRCITRFKSIAPSEHTLYIHQAFYVKPTEESISRLHAQLQRYSNNFTLLFVYYSEVNSCSTSFEVVPFVKHASKVILVNATIINDINGVVYLHRADWFGMCQLLNSTFDFSSLNATPFEMNDINEEKAYISDMYLP